MNMKAPSKMNTKLDKFTLSPQDVTAPLRALILQYFSRTKPLTQINQSDFLCPDKCHGDKYADYKGSRLHIA